MISNIRIKNFKSLKNVSLNLKELNLMMGLNSMGKSSVVQSLLMLRQSYIKTGSFKNLYINGELVSLGNSKDVFYQNADVGDLIEFEIAGEKSSCFVSYNYVEGKDVLDSNEEKVFNETDLSLFSNCFHYLAADHISPSKTYKATNALSNKFNILGNNGENAPYILSKIGNYELQNSLLHNEKSNSNLIAHELDAWMSEISPGTRILAEEIPNLDLVRVSFEQETKVRVSNTKLVGEYSNKFSPVNVGFGIPYALPLILTILISNPGDLVIIENPESHLHPKGQSEIGRLIALAAQSGVQVICETHSDHVINGIRVSAKLNVVDNSKVNILYFNKNQETKLETEITEIRVDKNGELDLYPNGLLDEWGNLMSQLF